MYNEMRWNSPTFFSRCGEILSKTELKLCNGELPFRSFRLLGLDRLSGASFRPFFITSLGGVIRGEFNCFTGEPSLRGKKPSVVFIGDIVRSGDSVIRWVISLIGDVGESRLCDLARVSAIKRRACSRKRAWRCSSCLIFSTFRWIYTDTVVEWDRRWWSQWWKKGRRKNAKRKNKKNLWLQNQTKWNGNRYFVLFTSKSALPLSSTVLLLLFRRSIIALAFALISLCRESNF